MPLPPENPGSMGMSGSSIPPKYLIGGAVALAVIGYYSWTRHEASLAAANTVSANSPSSLNVNANIAPTSSLDQFPQNQLVPMSQLNMPGVNTSDINQQLAAAGQQQQVIQAQ